MLLYTDGVTESRMPDGSFFGEERLATCSLGACRGASPHEVVRRLTRTAIEHSRPTSATTPRWSTSAGTAETSMVCLSCGTVIVWGGATPVAGQLRRRLSWAK